MILDILAFRNKVMKCYTQPFYVQDKLENQEANMYRAMLEGGEKVVSKYKHLALYHFGTFDDIKGTYELLDQPEQLFDCDDLIAELPAEVN